MLKNYLKITLRNIGKNRKTSLINISGLAAAIACCILIFVFIHTEVTFDRFHDNIDRIYYLYTRIKTDNVEFGNYPGSAVVREMQSDFPEIVNSAIVEKERRILRKDDYSLELTGLSTEASFFSIFNFPICGGITEPLQNRYSIILSAETAQRLYGTKDPVGKTVSLKAGETFVDYLVSGVTRPVPDNSSLRFDFIVNIYSLHGDELADAEATVPAFIQLADDGALHRLRQKFLSTYDKELLKRYTQLPGNPRAGYELHALSDYHLAKGMPESVLEEKGSIIYSYVLAGIGLLILLIACFNYANLSIRNLSTRFKEVGMRKVLGAQQKEIARQYITESIIITFISLMLGAVLAAAVLPYFSILVSRQLTFYWTDNWPLVVFLPVLAIGTGFFAGLYPALVSSRLEPVKLFNNQLKLTGSNRFGKGLIIMQFAISIFLVISTILMARQNAFLLQKDLGFNTEKVVRVDLDRLTDNTAYNRSFYGQYKNRIASYPDVVSVTGTAYPFTENWHLWLADKADETRILFHQNYTDYNYVDLFKMDLLSGRSFSKSKEGNAANELIVNQAFVEELGMSRPLEESLSTYFSGDFFAEKKIIGVVKNFHYQSLVKKIGPMCLILNREHQYKHVYVKFRGSIAKTISTLEKEFKDLAPAIPFEFSFVDEGLAAQYTTEQKWAKIVTIASFLAVALACSGLLGLAMYVIVKRTKEISIRKVLGASVGDIVILLNREFLLLVAAANVLAWPAAWFFVRKWLDNFAFRITPGIDVFIAAGLITLCVAVLTISMQSFSAARRNPAETLKYE